MADFKVVVTDIRFPSFAEEESVLKEIGAELVLTDCFTPEAVIEACADADAVLANMAPCTAEAIDGMKKCKVISRYGVGVDNVDVARATEKGIYVANVPSYCEEDVSDHAMALLLTVARNVMVRDRGVRQGRWNIEEGIPTYRIQDKTVGMIGFGGIARSFIRKIRGFEPAHILVFDPFVDASEIEKLGGGKAELDEVYAESDYISVHAPLNDHTRGMINKDAFGTMARKPVLVNTSRGGLIDEDAMIAALKTGQLRGAGLDVFDGEPLKDDSGLRELNNVVLTDHCSYYSEESLKELQQMVARNAAEVLKGNKPLFYVNKDVG